MVKKIFYEISFNYSIDVIDITYSLFLYIVAIVTRILKSAKY